jgi:predicted enzyme related to lactoylglutathione lyase
MTTIEKHQAGTFSWVELATSDQAAATDFYTKLFGWEKQDNPLPDGGIYTIGLVGGRPAAAVGQQQPQEREQGIHSHWNLYVASDDVDKTAALAQEAGGTIMAPPFDVMDLGRMAVIADPTGAVISVWQSYQMPGFAVRDEHGSFSWPELLTKDTDRAKAFYGDVFGWTADDMPMPDGRVYTMFKLGETNVGGLFPPPAEDIPPTWMVYFDVADCEGTVATAKASGAQELQAPKVIEGMGTFAVLLDPTKAVFAVFQSTQQSA